MRISASVYRSLIGDLDVGHKLDQHSDEYPTQLCHDTSTIDNGRQDSVDRCPEQDFYYHHWKGGSEYGFPLSDEKIEEEEVCQGLSLQDLCWRPWIPRWPFGRQGK